MVAQCSLASSAHVLEDADIALVERDVGLLTQGYLTDPARVVGKQKPAPTGGQRPVLAPVSLEQAEAVRGRPGGDSARTATINVKMPGEALSDGAPGPADPRATCARSG